MRYSDGLERGPRRAINFLAIALFIFAIMTFSLPRAFAAETAGTGKFVVPELTGPVVDDAGVLDGRTRAALSRGLIALKESGGSQITVLTVKSLEGVSVEEAGIKVFDAWKLGGQKTDNGAILLVAPNDRKVRIEVGQGLEGSLTDVDSKRIIEEAILPLFRSGDYGSGVLVGTYQIVRKTDPNFDLRPYFESRGSSQQRSEGSPLRFKFFLGLMLLFFIMSLFGRGRGGGGGTGFLLGALLGSAGRGGGFGGGGGWGGGGGFGGGGGGWSGGGGSGSGGGASGGW